MPLLLAVSALAFLVAALMPGGIAVALLGENATPETVANIEARLGLNDLLPVQYARWLGGALRGDLGEPWTLKWNREHKSEFIITWRDKRWNTTDNSKATPKSQFTNPRHLSCAPVCARAWRARATQRLKGLTRSAKSGRTFAMP
jgi:hypothetical protein